MSEKPFLLKKYREEECWTKPRKEGLGRRFSKTPEGLVSLHIKREGACVWEHGIAGTVPRQAKRVCGANSPYRSGRHPQGAGAPNKKRHPIGCLFYLVRQEGLGRRFGKTPERSPPRRGPGSRLWPKNVPPGHFLNGQSPLGFESLRRKKKSPSHKGTGSFSWCAKRDSNPRPTGS